MHGLNWILNIRGNKVVKDSPKKVLRRHHKEQKDRRCQREETWNID